MKWIDKVSRKYERFGIRNLMLFVAIGNFILLFVSAFQGKGGELYVMQTMTFHLGSILNGEIWRLLTFIFIPQDFSIFFLIIMAFFYFSVGKQLEIVWGHMRFTLFFFSGVVLTALASCFTGIPVGAYFICYSIVLAFGAVFPEHTILLFFIIPIKAMWLGVIGLGIFIYWTIAVGWPACIIPAVALLNFAIFCWGDIKQLVKYYSGRVKAAPKKKNTVNFSDALKKSKESKGYIHKCDVCGKTDTEHPDMEFRYCSLCTGYKCYCEEHLFHHEHK